MCEWGDTVPLRVFICAQDSYNGQERWTTAPIDRCIAPLVEALNAAGVITRASCCGHGKQDGLITLQDGRALYIR